MNSDVVFAACYATAMVATAAGIDAAGRTSARRRPGRDSHRDSHTGSGSHEPSWPHSGSMAVHTAAAAVAVCAGLAVAVVMGLRHHHAADLLVLAAPVLLATVMARRLSGRLRAATPSAGRPDRSRAVSGRRWAPGQDL